MSIVRKETRKKIVEVGTTVVLKLVHGETHEDLTGEITIDPLATGNGAISVNSPLARCILGKQVGFSGEYVVNASKIEVQILEIH